MTKGIIPAAVLTVALAGVASAGVVDSPVPSISGLGSTRVLYIVPGVIKNNGLETAFMCTSLDSAVAAVAVEVFAPEGGGALNDTSTGTANGTLSIVPGETVTISTGTSVGLHEDTSIVNLGNVKNGSARVLATSTRLVCTAILVEKSGTTPATVAALKVFARRKQNGD
jgi:hypothetical protein